MTQRSSDQGTCTAQRPSDERRAGWRRNLWHGCNMARETEMGASEHCFIDANHTSVFVCVLFSAQMLVCAFCGVFARFFFEFAHCTVRIKLLR